MLRLGTSRAPSLVQQARRTDSEICVSVPGSRSDHRWRPMKQPAGPQDPDRFRSEGDLNSTPRRRAWAAANLSPQTQRLLEEDAKYFLHQSLSTPCLNALRACGGAWVEDVA